jgi:acyl-CoA reductase-like NAD-dependent aldehyde dehydrogenase
VLDAVGSEILARKDEIGRLLSREEGKTLPEGIGETVRAGMIFKFFAGEALRCGGEVMAVGAAGRGVEVFRQPVGVVGPDRAVELPHRDPGVEDRARAGLRQLRGLQAGRAGAGCGWTLADILHRAGVPKGVFNLVMGPGQSSATRWSKFTEGRRDQLHRVGGHRQAAHHRRLLRARRQVQAEMGGKNPLVVLDDADLGVAVNAAVTERVLLDRPALHGIEPHHRHRRHPRPFRRCGDRKNCRLKVDHA